MGERECSFRSRLSKGLKNTKEKNTHKENMLSFLDKFAITSNRALHNNTVPQYYKQNNT